MRSRKKIIISCILVILFIMILIAIFGYIETWRLWKIPTMSPNFADLRVITSGAESLSEGFDPRFDNPNDPWQRNYNYPKILIIIFSSLGINQDYTTYIGIGFIFLFLLGVCLIVPDASNLEVLLVMASLMSPATLLCIERGNIDLLLFFLIALSVVTINRFPNLSISAIIIGFIMKLFPIFGFSIFIRKKKVEFIRISLILLLTAILYTSLTFSDILLVSKTTPRSTNLTYGINVFWMKVEIVNPALGIFAKIIFYMIAIAIILFAITAIFRKDFNSEEKSATKYLDSFRAGTAIYLGTFFLGNNYDYRLIFLIFAIPQLVQWIKYPVKNIAVSSKVILTFIFFSLWYLIIADFIRSLPNGIYYSFALKHFSHWIVFSGLFYLFFWSMPEWPKSHVQKLLSVRSLFG